MTNISARILLSSFTICVSPNISHSLDYNVENSAPKCIADSDSRLSEPATYIHALLSLALPSGDRQDPTLLIKREACAISLQIATGRTGISLTSQEKSDLYDLLEPRDEITTGIIFDILYENDDNLGEHLCLMRDVIERTKAYIMRGYQPLGRIKTFGTIRLSHYGLGAMLSVESATYQQYGDRKCN